MYILIIGRNHPKPNKPLGGIFEFDQAKALKLAGNKVIFVSLDLRSLRHWRRWGISTMVIDEILIYNLSIPLGRLPFCLVVFIASRLLRKAFKRIYADEGIPALIHAHFTLNAAIAGKLRIAENIPLIVTEHSSKLNRTVISRRIYSLGKAAFTNADAIISVSNALACRLKRHFNVDSVVIPNIVDVHNFRFVPRGIQSSNFIFISVGNLTDNKGFELLIEAFKIAGFSEDVELQIVGQGPKLPSLKKMVKEYGLERQIKFLGFLTRQKIAQLMSLADAFVLASKSETFGVVLIEALAAGLPVISTACGGPEDFIIEMNGKLVPLNDPAALSTALRNMVKNLANYDRSEISQDCVSRFSSEVVSRQLMKLYQQFA